MLTTLVFIGSILLESDAIEQAVLQAGDSTATTMDAATKSSDTNNQQANESTESTSTAHPHKVKIIDFGSACFEGHTAHTYIQSRFYRCPEVIIGLPYDSGIDMWSLGCVAAELFLGLPILPGCHEHDQLGRIQEMIAGIPDWMLEQGSKSTKYYVKYRPNVTPNPERASPMQATGGSNRTPSPWTPATSASPSALPLPQWRLKTQPEYIASLSQNDISKKGGLAKLEKQPGHRYFKSQKLVDIVASHAQSRSGENRELLSAFTHFLYGLLEPDPWKRFTALQVVQHPFLTGNLSDLKKVSEPPAEPKEENQANLTLGLYWQVPWDPAILRRKLLNVQRQREKQQSSRRNTPGRSPSQTSMMGDLSLQSDPRVRSRMDVSSTPTADNPMQRQAVAIGRSSPPDRLSQRLFPVENRTGVMSASLSHLGGGTSGTSTFGADIRSEDVTSLHPRTVLSTGPQSFGAHDDIRRAAMAASGDFAFVLNRPGIVPGASSASGWESETPVGSLQYGGSDLNNNLRLRQLGSFDQELYPSTPSHIPHQSNRSVSSSLRSTNTSTTLQGRDAHGTQAQSFASQQQYATIPSQQHQHQQPIAQQGLQFHQPQHHHHQQQQQLFGMAPSSQMMQQQAVYPMKDQSGQVYYVTTSATGQPVILQPVANPGNYLASPQSQWQASIQPQAGYGQEQQSQMGYQQPSTMPPPTMWNNLGYGGAMYVNQPIPGNEGLVMHGNGGPLGGQIQPASQGSFMVQQQQPQYMYQQQPPQQYIPLQYPPQGHQPPGNGSRQGQYHSRTGM